MNFEYETKRLLMRVEHSGMAEDVLDFYRRNRPYFDAFEMTRADNFYSKAYQSASLQLEYNEIIKKKYVRFWIYEKKNPKKIIGTVSISNIVMGCFRTGMFGYKLDHVYWGKGYATEACEKLIEIAKELGLHRLEAFIMPANEKSIRLIERLNFDYEGISYKSLEVNHKYEDHYRYALILQ